MRNSDVRRFSCCFLLYLHLTIFTAKAEMRVQKQPTVENFSVNISVLENLQSQVEDLKNLRLQDKTKVENLERLIHYQNLVVEIQNLRAEINLLSSKLSLIGKLPGPGILNIGQTSSSKVPSDSSRYISSKSWPIDKRHPESCDEVDQLLAQESTQKIYPNGRRKLGVDVLCDFETDGGGWTIIQKRSSGPKEQFYGNWTEYERGFGLLYGNFWIGLKTIHALTKDEDQELRVDLWDFEGDHTYAKYSRFFVADSAGSFRLDIGGYSGTAGDSLYRDNEQIFITKDKANLGLALIGVGIVPRTGEVPGGMKRIAVGLT